MRLTIYVVAEREVKQTMVIRQGCTHTWRRAGGPSAVRSGATMATIRIYILQGREAATPAERGGADDDDDSLIVCNPIGS